MWNIGPSVIVVQWVMFGLCVLAITIRIGACRRPEYGFWWDDFVMFFSLAVYLATCITGNLALAWGVGKYSNEVNPYVLPRATLMGIIATDLGMLADAIPKVGVALLIIRLFHPKIWIKWAMITATLLNVLFNVLLIIFSFIQCQPAKYQWNRDTVDGTCWNIRVYTDFAFFTGAFTAGLDLVFSFYPLFVISKLRLQWRKKVAIMATMSFGFGTFAVTLYKVATQYPKFLHAAYDATRVLANIMLWNALGASFTIIAGSIPTFGWMFHTKRWKHFLGWVTGGKISASSSRRTSGIAEKWPFVIPTQSQRPSPETSGRPSRDEAIVPNHVPLTFPQSAHYSGRSYATTTTGGTNSRHQSQTQSRAQSVIQPRPQNKSQGQLQHGGSAQDRAWSQPLPFDSIHALERSTWMG